MRLEIRNNFIINTFLLILINLNKWIYIFLVIAALLLVTRFLLIFIKFKNDKFAKSLSEFNSNFIPLIAIIISLLINDNSQKKPLVNIVLDCTELNTMNLDSSYNYIILLKNDGDIDAQITKLELYGGREIYFQEYFNVVVTVPSQDSRQIVFEKGNKPESLNFLIAEYYLSYTCSNGFSDVKKNDTIFCFKNCLYQLFRFCKNLISTLRLSTNNGAGK